MARVVVDGIPGRQGCTYRHVSIRFLQPVGSAGGSPRTATVPDEVTSVFEQPAAKCSTKLSSIRDGVEERSIYYDSKQFESSEETDPSSLDIAKELRDVRREMACLKSTVAELTVALNALLLGEAPDAHPKFRH